MDERLLIKCENTIVADEVVELLHAHGIVSRQHDESQDPRIGAYGPLTGISIFVFERDYELAKTLVAPVWKEKNAVRPFCPKCGSENTVPVVRRSVAGLIVLSVLLVVVPAVYIGLPKELGLRSGMADYIALFMAIVGIVLAFTIKTYNYRCADCGKKFTR